MFHTADHLDQFLILLDIAAKHNIKAYIRNESTWLEVGRFENIAEINAKKLDFLYSS